MTYIFMGKLPPKGGSLLTRIKLIQKLSTLSNVQLIVFVNVLSVDNPEMFDILTKVTEWENKILSEFMEENKKENCKENCEENNEKTNKKTNKKSERRDK